MDHWSILLVDDDADLGLVVRTLGRRAGWNVEHRPDAAAAWEALRQAVPDLLLLDVNLPGESGPDFCRRLLAEPRLNGLAVALFAQLALSADVAAGLEAGADFFVAK